MNMPVSTLAMMAEEFIPPMLLLSNARRQLKRQWTVLRENEQACDKCFASPDFFDSLGSMNRRDILHTAAVAGTAAALFSPKGLTAGVPPISITDTNVSLFQWPFRRLPLDDTEGLVRKFRQLGITQAWAGSFEAILHRDLRAVNDRLVRACRGHAELLPVGAINPALPGWEGDLRRCVVEHMMHAIRIHPNYHGYTLNDVSFLHLLKLAGEAGLLVQIPVAMEDIRTQNRLVEAPDVDLSTLANRLVKIPKAKIQILNHRNPLRLKGTLAAFSGVYFDMARVDGTDGPAKFLRGFPPGRVMFGSHSPFLIP